MLTYNRDIMRLTRLLIPAGALFLILLPHVGLAASLTAFDPIIPASAQGGACACPGSAPGWGCVLQVIQNVINTGVSLGVIIMVLYLALGGAQLITSAGSPGAREQSKQRLTNGVVGMIVLLSAWLIVDFIMKTLYGGQFGPWNAILASSGSDQCIKATEPVSLITGSISILQGAAPSGAAGTGSASGDCSQANLANDWGSTQKGALFSCIVNNESKCQNIATQAASNVAGSGSSAGGRYQVTMQSGPKGQGLNFPACVAVAQQNGFTGTTLNCASAYPNGVSNGSALAQQCRAAQLDPTCNTQAAEYLYNNGGVSHWLGVGDVGGKNQACVDQYGT